MALFDDIFGPKEEQAEIPYRPKEKKKLVKPTTPQSQVIEQRPIDIGAKRTEGIGTTQPEIEESPQERIAAAMDASKPEIKTHGPSQALAPDKSYAWGEEGLSGLVDPKGGLSDEMKGALAGLFAKGVAGLLPAAIEATAGGGKYMGAAYAGGLHGVESIEKREAADIKAAQIPGSARRYQAVKYEDENNKIKLGVFDRATGDFKTSADGDRLAGYRIKSVKDEYTGEFRSVSGATGTIREAARKGDALKEKMMSRFKPKDEADLAKITDLAYKNPLIKENNKLYTAAQKAEALVTPNIAFATEGTKALVARMMSEVGVLSDYDIRRFSGRRDIPSRAKQQFELMTTGKWSEVNHEELMIIIQSVKKMSSGRLDAQISKMAEGGAFRYTIPEKDVRRAIEEVKAVPVKSEEIVEGVKKERASLRFQKHRANVPAALDWAKKNISSKDRSKRSSAKKILDEYGGKE